MCGITGIFYKNKELIVSKELLKNMSDSIAHRGPDGEGFFVDNNIGLAHRRLSIIDVEEGIQPMTSIDDTVVISFNGEIYNYIELKKELRDLGYQFRTHSDTEVILVAYQHWGIEFQNKLNGMWALALYDKVNQKLILSRDRIGEKPLYFYHNHSVLVFGSEIKTIQQFGISLIPRLELTELYLFYTNIPGNDTFYKDIYELKPGHYIEATLHSVEEKQYWELPFTDEHDLLHDKNSIYEEFESLFIDSIRIRMRSDVPFGAFLSGGLDSSSIVSCMSQFSENPIETFTIGFPEKEFDESHLAQLVATKFKTKHTVQTVEPESFENMISMCSKHFDEPFGDSSALPTYVVSKYARKHVKMVLTGDGGDEVLSGYNSYLGLKLTQIYNNFPNVITKSIPKITQKMLPFAKNNIRYKLNKVAHFTHSASLPFQERLLEKKPYLELAKIKNLTQDLDCIPIEDYMSDIFQKIPYQDAFYQLMYLNFKYDLPNDYLVKVDRMSMANSLETRTPFLDYRLIEFMTKVDKKVKMQGLERKSILRKTVAKQLPSQLLNASKKGFGIPLHEWFKKDNTLDKISLSNVNSLLNNEPLNTLLSDNKLGKADYGNFIWTLIMLEKGLEK